MSTNRENDHGAAPPSLPSSWSGSPAYPDPGLRVMFTCRRVGGPAGRALAAAQARALADLLAVLAQVEVGQEREAGR